MTMTISAIDGVNTTSAPLKKAVKRRRRPWRMRAKEDTEGPASVVVRCAVAELYPNGIPAWLCHKRRDTAITNWAWERGFPRDYPSRRTIRRYFRERA